MHWEGGACTEKPPKPAASFTFCLGAPVSMPLTWDELAGAHPLDFRVTNVAQRLAQTGDRWRDALNNKQSLEHALSS